MDILVLGGTRFLGLNLVRLLHNNGHRLTVLNRGISPVVLPEGTQRLYADRSLPDQITGVLKGKRFDVVYDISGYKPDEVRPVMEIMDGNVGQYVFCSSVALYAKSITVPINEACPLNRSNDASQYAKDKVACEELLVEQYERSRFPVTMMRPPYIYGPSDTNPRRLFSIFMRLKLGRPIIIPGEGYTLSHPVHVDDVARAFTGVIGRKSVIGQAYNTPGPEAISANGLISTVASIMGIGSEIVHYDTAMYEEMLRAHPHIIPNDIFNFPWRDNVVYSYEKLKSETGWIPEYHIRDGIEMTCRWWLEQGLDKEEWDFSMDDSALYWLKSHQPSR